MPPGRAAAGPPAVGRGHPPLGVRPPGLPPDHRRSLPAHPAARPGEHAEVTVYAHQPWNDTGLYLDPGGYQLTASGEWIDGSVTSGPDGVHDYLHIKDVLGTVTGWWQETFRHLTHNEAANTLAAPRVSAPWMTPCGAVAAPNIDEDGAQQPYPLFSIGEGVQHKVERPGYLYAFANDAWGGYANNRGSVSLRVQRLR